MKSILVFLALIMGSFAYAADVTSREGLPDGSQSVTRQYKDIGGSIHAPTVNTVEAYDWVKIAGTTTTVKTSPGILHSITVNTDAAVAFIVYDSTASTVTSTPIASFEASVPHGTYFFDAKMANGIQINCAGSGPDITVSYK